MGESLTNGQEHRQRNATNVVVTDPTNLTTEAILREIGQLKALLRSETLGHIKVSNEQFNAVAKQFESVERQRIEQKLDTKAAVDAALIAQKEAVKEQTLASERAISKSEAATTKQLDQQAAGFSASITGVFNQLNDLKDRITEVRDQVTKIDSNKQGSTDRANNTNTIIIAVLALITMGSIIMGIVQHMGK